MADNKLVCLKCGTVLDSKGIRRALRVARCSQCKGVFSMREVEGQWQLQEAGPMRRTPVAPAETKRQYETVPRRITVRRGPRSLGIELKWYLAFDWLQVVFGLIAFAFLGFIVLLVQGEASIDVPRLLLLYSVVGLMLIAFGGILYGGIGKLVNTTHIDVTEQEILIKFRPLWFPGAKRVAASCVGQVYCTMEMVSNHSTGTHKHSSLLISYYHVHMISVSGETVTLLKGLRFSDEALFIEQEIEKFLRIQDRAVEGESKSIEKVEGV